MRFDQLTTSSPYKMACVLLSVLVIGNAGALTACGQKTAPSTADHIGIDAAKEAALRAADISADQAAILSAGLDNKNGTFYYQVVFQGNGSEYEYAIDALTGVVIEEKHTPLQPEGLVDAASETGVTAAPDSTAPQPDAAPGQSLESGQNTANGQGAANEKTPGNGQGAANGQTLENGQGASNGQTPGNGQGAVNGQSAANGTKAAAEIDPDTAFSIALSHAGLTEADVAFHQVKTDMENGQRTLEVEFMTSDGTEYSYELRAADGTILSYDYDAGSRSRNALTSGSGLIPEEQAKQTVLDRVPGAPAENIKIRLDEDDGRLEYEGKLYYDNMEYEFKIDAYSGSLIEWEAESIFMQ